MIHIDKVHGSTLTASTACVFSIQLCEKRAKITTLRHVGCVAAIRPRNDIIRAQRVTDSYSNRLLPDRKMYRALDLIRREARNNGRHDSRQTKHSNVLSLGVARCSSRKLNKRSSVAYYRGSGYC